MAGIEGDGTSSHTPPHMGSSDAEAEREKDLASYSDLISYLSVGGHVCSSSLLWGSEGGVVTPTCPSDKQLSPKLQSNFPRCWY